MSNQKEKKNFYTEMMRKVDLLSYFTNEKSEKKIAQNQTFQANISVIENVKFLFLCMWENKS